MWIKLSSGMFVPHGGDAGAFSFEQDEMSVPVKNGSDPASSASPFYPQEQTSSDHPGMPEKCPVGDITRLF
jgi:hypothetical protein